MLFVNDVGGSGVFIFNVDGQLKRLFCDQFLPNATTLPYVATVSTLNDLSATVLGMQGDPQALIKYQRVAILVLLALADPSLAVDVVKVNRRIVDGAFPLTPSAQALFDFILLQNPADYDLSGFKIYTAANTQEVVGYDSGYVTICKVAGPGVAVGTNFTFNVAGTPVVVAAGAAPGGTCSVPLDVRSGARIVSETVPVGTTVSSLSTTPVAALLNANLVTGTATVNVPVAAAVTVTFVDTAGGGGTFTGFIQVCKVAGPGVLVGTPANFNVAGTSLQVAAGVAPGGNCAPAVEVPVGPAVVSETLLGTMGVVSVSAVPGGALAGSNTATGTASLTVAAGVHITLTFTNRELGIVPNVGFLQICKVAGLGVPLGTPFGYSVGGNPVTAFAGPAPNGYCSGALPVPVGSAQITESLPPGAMLVGVSTLPNPLFLTASNLAAGTATVTVVDGGLTTVTFVNTYIPPPITDPSYYIKYVSNLNWGDGYVNITNTGAGGAGLGAGTFATTTGSFCANVYVFSPDEQMVSCCSCPVTPNGLVSLSARNDLIGNTLTPAVPTSIVVKLLATLPLGGSCTASAAQASAVNLAPGLAAWATTIHVGPTALATTETPFSAATLTTSAGNDPSDIGELARLTRLCTFINANGSGFGICRSCRLGGLGSGRL